MPGLVANQITRAHKRAVDAAVTAVLDGLAEEFDLAGNGAKDDVRLTLQRAAAVVRSRIPTPF